MARKTQAPPFPSVIRFTHVTTVNTLGFIAGGGPEGGDGELLVLGFGAFSSSMCIINKKQKPKIKQKTKGVRRVSYAVTILALMGPV